MEYVNENLRRKRELEDRTQRFAVSVFRFLDTLPPTASSRVVSYQLGKSASSIGANYQEANRAESRNDFVHKLRIVLKEASETQYWLKTLDKLYVGNERIRDLLAESTELVRIFQSSCRSLRANQDNNKIQS